MALHRRTPLKFDNLDYYVSDRVAEITMRRAPVNAIDHGLIEDINNAYRQAKADTGVRAVILTSAFERSFSAGMDLNEYFRLVDAGPPVARIRSRRASAEWQWRRLKTYSKPTIAMVNGWCFGGGYGPLFACDLAFAAEEAQFGLSEINWGILPGGGATKVAVELLPFRKAMYHAMMGENLTGRQAEEQGLITEAVPAERLKDRVLEICEALKKKDGHALRATKWVMRRIVDMTYDNALEYQIRTQEALHSFGGKEARKEATKQFLDEKSYKPGLGTFDTSKLQDG
jgi:trans-feruloyl-CoA hydratase/vanillin synthase